MSIIFTTSLRRMTYRHYLANPMPMVERLINRNLFKKYDLIKNWMVYICFYTCDLMKVEKQTYRF